MSSSDPDSSSQHHRWQRIPPALRILLGAFAVIVLLVVTRPEAPEVPISPRIWTVSTDVVRLQSLSPVVKLLGKLESRTNTTHASRITAFVEEVPVKPGDRVRPGDVLVKLDRSDVTLALQQREAELLELESRIVTEKTRRAADEKALKIEQELIALTERSVRRFERLARNNLGAQTQLDEARRQLAQQRLSYTARQAKVEEYDKRFAELHAQLEKVRSLRDRALLDFERATVVAGFTGRVAAVHVSRGDTVSPGQSLVTVYDTGQMEAKAQVPARWVPVLRNILSGRHDHQAPVAGSIDDYLFPFAGIGWQDGRPLSLWQERAPTQCFAIGRQSLPAWWERLLESLTAGEKPKAVVAGQEWLFVKPHGQDHRLQAKAEVEGRGLHFELARLGGNVDEGTGGIDAWFTLQDIEPVEQGRIVELALSLPETPAVLSVPATALHGINRVYLVEQGRLVGVDVERVGNWQAADGSPRVLVRSPRLFDGQHVMTTQLPNAVSGLPVRESVDYCR